MAYNSVLTERKRMLHGSIGAALEKLHADRLDDHLAELAHHFARSSETAKAVEYLLKAGQNAVQRSAYRQALDQLEAGLRLLESLPTGAARDKQELELRAAMWTPLRTVRGPASGENWRNTKRAQELFDQGNVPARLVHEVLRGLFSYYLFVANMEMAHRLAGQILALGDKSGDEIITSTEQTRLGITRALMGEYRDAATSLERSIAICERVLPTCQQPLLRQTMVDNLINSRGHLSEALWMLGYPGQALRQIELFHRLPGNLCGSFQIATSLLYDLLSGCKFVRDYTGAREKGETLRALSTENGFLFMEAYAAVLLGHVAVEQGTTEDGIKALLQGRETLKAALKTFSSEFLAVPVEDRVASSHVHFDHLRADPP